MKITITGGSGFLGSHVADELSKRGHKVKIFDKKQFTFIQNNTTSMDFYLFKFAKHFIVGPSSFHWWGAWLNTNPNKICVRPPGFLNPSDNIDFWPLSWKVLV